MTLRLVGLCSRELKLWKPPHFPENPPTVHNSPTTRKHPLNRKPLCAQLNKTKIRQTLVAQAALPRMLLGFSCVTLQQVVSGFILDLCTQLPGLLQVFQNKDIGGEVDHVLLPTSKGQTQQLVQVVESRPHDVP